MTDNHHPPCALREHPERAIAADDLLRRTLEEHHASLLLPRDEGGRLYNYAALSLPFPAPKSLGVPKSCFLDLSRFKELSEQFVSEHPEAQLVPWEYRWFYLELLCDEDKLKPRLWATDEAVAEGLPLIDVTIDNPRSVRFPERLHEASCCWWADRGEELLARRAVFEHEDRPWLDYLVPDASVTMLGPGSPRPAPIAMSARPVYLWPEDGVIRQGR